MKSLENQPLTAHRGTNFLQGKARYCKTCEREIKSKNSKKEFCCDKCRLLHWAVKTLIKEYKAEKANGLRNLIKELCE